MASCRRGHRLRMVRGDEDWRMEGFRGLTAGPIQIHAIESVPGPALSLPRPTHAVLIVDDRCQGEPQVRKRTTEKPSLSRLSRKEGNQTSFQPERMPWIERSLAWVALWFWLACRLLHLLTCPTGKWEEGNQPSACRACCSSRRGQCVKRYSGGQWWFIGLTAK